jgi:hypothetical protein
MKCLLLIMLAFSIPAMAQHSPGTADVKSYGECSPNIIANVGEVKITCNASLDQATANKLASLLTQILRKGTKDANTLEEINRKIDKLQAEASKPTETINAPNGIAIGGDAHVENPTVNNVIPPERHLAMDQRATIIGSLRGKKG